jgi:uncharacterized protein (DUF486 family)
VATFAAGPLADTGQHPREGAFVEPAEQETCAVEVEGPAQESYGLLDTTAQSSVEVSVEPADQETRAEEVEGPAQEIYGLLDTTAQPQGTGSDTPARIAEPRSEEVYDVAPAIPAGDAIVRDSAASLPSRAAATSEAESTERIERQPGDSVRFRLPNAQRFRLFGYAVLVFLGEAIVLGAIYGDARDAPPWVGATGAITILAALFVPFTTFGRVKFVWRRDGSLTTSRIQFFGLLPIRYARLAPCIRLGRRRMNAPALAKLKALVNWLWMVVFYVLAYMLAIGWSYGLWTKAAAAVAGGRIGVWESIELLAFLTLTILIAAIFKVLTMLGNRFGQSGQELWQKHVLLWLRNPEGRELVIYYGPETEEVEEFADKIERLTNLPVVRVGTKNPS